MLDDPDPSIYLTDFNSTGQPGKSIIIKPDYHSPLSTSTTTFWKSPRKQEQFLERPWTLLKEVFLPAGWPNSVSKDYTEYQIYDSLQAFASTIAGLLSSRAVLTGIGVGDATATPTAALLLHILQDSTGRLATILFAHRLGAALEPETKMYRLLADVFNDISIILDCASPLLPRGFMRITVLSTAGILRALCGVAAGATKASLSVHFAAGGDGNGNVGELNAKDASQETVISLVGSLVGSLVVSWVVGGWWTWSVLLALLGVHLSMNARAVRAVRLRTLNRQRAGLVFRSLFAGKGVRNPDEVYTEERIFERDGVVRDFSGRIIGWGRIGVTMEEIAQQMHQKADATTEPKTKQKDILPPRTSSSYPNQIFEDNPMATMIDLFSDSNYILFPDRTRQTILISLAENASSVQQLKAWAHAILILQRFSTLSTTDRQSILDSSAWDIVQSTKHFLDTRWDEDISALRAAGWDLDTASLETRSGSRYRMQTIGSADRYDAQRAASIAISEESHGFIKRDL